MAWVVVLSGCPDEGSERADTTTTNTTSDATSADDTTVSAGTDASADADASAGTDASVEAAKLITGGGWHRATNKYSPARRRKEHDNETHVDQRDSA